MWLLILLTWVEYFLSSAVTCTERAVDLEVVGVIQEGSTQGEQHSLKSQHNYIIISITLQQYQSLTPSTYTLPVLMGHFYISSTVNQALYTFNTCTVDSI